MKISQYFIVTFCLFAFLSSFSPILGQVQYKDLKYPPLNEFKIPEVERLVLDNGLVLYLLEDHELPMVNLAGLVRFNNGDEPEEKIGLIKLFCGALRSGGTKNKKADEVDQELDRIAALVSFGSSSSYGSFSVSSLKEKWDQAFSLFLDILKNPAFQEEKIELKKIEERSLISRRNDEPFPIAIREFNKMVYGPTSPFARHTEYATINAITRDDLLAFHQGHFHPERMMVAVWGDFKIEEMKKKIQEAFKDWPKGDVSPTKIPEVVEYLAAPVNLVEKNDLNQSGILLGHLGGMMDNPDYFALEVMNNVLGGGFASRLFKRVRSDQGLAYSVFGNYRSGFDHPGPFYVGCLTKSENTMKAIKSLLREVDELRITEITDEELALAKDSYLNSFVFNFDSRSEIINRLMELEYFGFPKDFLEITKKNIEKVSKADVKRVAEKYLQPDKIKIMVVGKPKDFDGALETLGKVNLIDITIPANPDIASGGPTSAHLSEKK